MTHPVSLAFAILLVHPLALRATEPSLAERFRNEAPAKWEELGKLAKNYQAKSEYRTAEVTDGKRTETERSTHEWKWFGDHALVQMRQFPPDEAVAAAESETVFGANPYYLFALERRKGKTDWLLQSVVRDPAAGEGVTVGDPPVLIRQIYHAFLRGVLVGNALPHEVVTLPRYQFVVTGPVTEQPPGSGLVRVPFRFVDEAKIKRLSSACEGHLVLDSRRYWALVRSEVEIGYANQPKLHHLTREVTEVTYDTDGIVPLLKSSSQTVTIFDQSSGKVERQIVKTTEAVTRPAGTLNEPNFRLSAYGLPEPVGVPAPRSSRLHLWLILGGAGCLGLGAAVLRYARRRRPGLPAT